MSAKDEKLPLGATRLASGEVVVPASRRADGSMRKPVRIRQGYVPQDEVAKYKTPAQRRREQQERPSASAEADAEALVTEMQTLSMKDQASASDAADRGDIDTYRTSQKEIRKAPPSRGRGRTQGPRRGEPHETKTESTPNDTQRQGSTTSPSPSPRAAASKPKSITLRVIEL